MKRFVSVLLVLSLILISLTGCSNQESSSLQDKNISELEYIEGKLVKILNEMARDEYLVGVSTTDNLEENTNLATDDSIVTKKIDWEKLLKDTNKIESSIATTITDLTALNIEASEIEKLSTGVNNMIIAIEKEDINSYLISLNNVYALIPSYMEKYAGNNEKTFKKKLKYYTISAYIAYNDGNLEMAKTQASELERIYSEKMKEVGYLQNNEYNLNKLYILIQELKRAIDSDSKELVKSKYLLTIEEI
ncbi:MAG: hypothetical protein J6A36_02635 [Clostridia bacterium]|nr:hypothetical protein [Clostridia bacterium]